jgi:hypothetical protein
VGFVVDKVALGQVFPPQVLQFSHQFHCTGAPLLGKGQQIIIIFIFIIALHKKPYGCGAPIVSVAGPFSIKKTHLLEDGACVLLSGSHSILLEASVAMATIIIIRTS